MPAKISEIIIPRINNIPGPLVKNEIKLSKNVGGGIQTTISTSQINSVVIPESVIIALISCILVPLEHNVKVKLSLFLPHSSSLITSLVPSFDKLSDKS